MKHETKQVRTPFAVKDVSAKERTFEGLASTWDLDLGGDVIHRGAFRKTLKEWRSGGKTVKLFYGHNYFSMDNLLGKMTEASETKAGLETTFKVVEGERGDTLLNLVGEGMLDSLSIGYRAVKVEYPDEDEERQGIFRHLKEVDLREVSAVPFPMNPEARIDAGSVKALLAGLDAKNLDDDERAQLKALQQQIHALLDGTPAPEPPAEPHGDMLATDDPKRLATSAMLRSLAVRQIRSAARTGH